MALKDLINNIKTKIKNAGIVHRAHVQASKVDLNNRAKKVQSEFIQPTLNDETGAYDSVVTQPDYTQAYSTDFVKNNALSGIYFSDTLTTDLRETLEDEFKKSNYAKFVYVHESVFPGKLTEAEIEEFNERYPEAIEEVNGKIRIKVSDYRQWQADNFAKEEEASNENLQRVEKFYKTAKEYAKEHEQDLFFRDFVSDSIDSYAIAEQFGGGREGILNKYSDYANIPVSVLALHSVLMPVSYTDAKGKIQTAQLTFNKDGSVNKRDYKQVRKALGEDRLVGFLDSLCGYTMQDDKVVELESTLESPVPLFTGLLPMAKEIQSQASIDFKLDAAYLVSHRVYKTKLVQLDSDCDKMIKEANYNSPNVSVDLQSQAQEFAEAAINGTENTSGTQNRFINRSERNLLRTVLRNTNETLMSQTKNTIIPKYKTIFDEMSKSVVLKDGDEKYVKENKYKFSEPREFDILSNYANDFAMIKDNILLINSVQMSLAPKISALEMFEFKKEDEVVEYAKSYGIDLDKVKLTELAKKFGVKLPKEINKDYLATAIILQNKQQVQNISELNSAVCDFIGLKEDLRVCEHILGQFKFKNLEAVVDIYSIAEKRVKEAQKTTKKSLKEKDLNDAKKTLKTLNERDKTLQRERKVLDSEYKQLQDEKIDLLNSRVQTIAEVTNKQLKTYVSNYIVSVSNSGLHRSFNVNSKQFEAIIAKTSASFDVSKFFDKDGNVDVKQIENAVMKAFVSIATANNNFALGIKNGPKITDGLKPFVDVCVKQIKDSAELAKANDDIARKDYEIEAKKGEIAEKNNEITENEKAIVETESNIEKIKESIDNMEMLPDKELVAAQKEESYNMAIVKSREFNQALKSLIAVVDKHQEMENDLIKKGVIVEKDGRFILQLDKSTEDSIKEKSVYDDFMRGFESYEEDKKALIDGVKNRVQEITKTAKEKFDLVIEIDASGRPVVNDKNEVVIRYIDNPTRVKGDISIDAITLYEKQELISIYDKILEVENEEERNGLIAKLPKEVQREIQNNPDNYRTIVSEQLSAERSTASQIAQDFLKLETKDEKHQFQQDYLRYKHYRTGKYLDADKVEESLTVEEYETLDKDLAELSVVEDKQAKTETLVEDIAANPEKPAERESTHRKETEPEVKPDKYRADVVEFVDNYRQLCALDDFAKKSNEERLAYVADMKSKGIDTSDYESYIEADGSVKETEFSALQEKLDKDLETICAKQPKHGTAEFSQFVDQATQHFINEQAKDGVVVESEQQAKQDIEKTLITHQFNKEQEEQNSVIIENGDVEATAEQNDDSKPNKNKKIKVEYTAKGCELALKSINKLIKKLEEQIKADKEKVAEEKKASEKKEETEPKVEEKEEIKKSNPKLRQAYLGLVYDELLSQVGGLSSEETKELFSKIDIEVDSEKFKDYVADGKLNVTEFLDKEYGIKVVEQKRAITAQVSTVKTGTVNEEGKIVNKAGVSVEEKLYERYEAGNVQEAVEAIVETKSVRKKKYIARNMIIYALGKGLIDKETVQSKSEQLESMLTSAGYEVSDENIDKLVSGKLPGVDISPLKEVIKTQIDANIPKKDKERV